MHTREVNATEYVAVKGVVAPGHVARLRECLRAHLVSLCATDDVMYQADNGLETLDVENAREWVSVAKRDDLEWLHAPVIVVIGFDHADGGRGSDTGEVWLRADVASTDAHGALVLFGYVCPFDY